MNTPRPAAFLDRDGTINVDKGYLYRIEDFVYLDGVVEGLRQLQQMGYLLVIITNQSGIARGFYTEEDYQALTDWMVQDLYGQGVQIGRVYHCPHHPQGKIPQYTLRCNCRKPETALFYHAARELHIDLEKSSEIGDKVRDLCICDETAVQGVLISEERSSQKGIICCRNWNEAIDKIAKFYS